MKIVKSILVIFASAIVLLIVNHLIISFCGRLKIIESTQIPKTVKYGLLLGAGKDYPSSRYRNYSFLGRMETTYKFHIAHPTVKIVLSGFADGYHYNEAEDMKKKLVEKGVNPEILILDDTSIDTFESLKMAKRLLGDQECIIISQKQHLCRAIWLADKINLNAFGLIAEGYPNGDPRWLKVREIGARIKARYDILFDKNN
jgi:SanA protein